MEKTEIVAVLRRLDGQPYARYQELKDTAFDLGGDRRRVLLFRHIQGSPGAAPASWGVLRFTGEQHIVRELISGSGARRLGCMDYLLRVFQQALTRRARPCRGEDGSGSFQLLTLPQQVLSRNAVHATEAGLEIAFRISLPGTARSPRILGEEASAMLRELDAAAKEVEVAVIQGHACRDHCDAVEDAEDARKQLEELGLVAFVADGSLLPRISGVSDLPAPRESAIPFHAPESLARHLTLKHRGNLRGMGIPAGVTVIIGGGFHGKSTLLNALAKGVYSHIRGDGRELVITKSAAVMVRAEDGRSVRGTNIAPFIRGLPGKADPNRFHTDNASGSTSQAAALVEAISSGAQLLFIDEDTSATNFLIKDSVMRRLVPDDPLIPLAQHAKNLYRDHGISTIMVVGGSSEYLGVADTVIRMHNYRAEDASGEVRSLNLSSPPQAEAMRTNDTRRLEPANFNPEYHASRQGKILSARIKPLRGEPRILEYGNDRIDLRSCDTLVDETQTLAIGYLLLAAHRRDLGTGLSPSQLAVELCGWISEFGLETLNNLGMEIPQLFAEPSPFEVAGAINRLRSLLVNTA